VITSDFDIRLMEMYEDRRRLNLDRRRRSLLAGSVWCGRCGAKMRHSANNGSPIYRCRNSDLSWPAWAADGLIDGIVGFWLRKVMGATDPLLDGWPMRHPLNLRAEFMRLLMRRIVLYPPSPLGALVEITLTLGQPPPNQVCLQVLPHTCEPPLGFREVITIDPPGYDECPCQSR